jgi:hypothetical protein
MQHAGRWDLSIPKPPTYAGKRFHSVHAALEDGPKLFEELMASLGSRDGREIVRDLHTLRHSHHGLERDDRGRYFIKAD